MPNYKYSFNTNKKCECCEEEECIQSSTVVRVVGRMVYLKGVDTPYTVPTGYAPPPLGSQVRFDKCKAELIFPRRPPQRTRTAPVNGRFQKWKGGLGTPVYPETLGTHRDIYFWRQYPVIGSLYIPRDERLYRSTRSRVDPFYYLFPGSSGVPYYGVDSTIGASVPANDPDSKLGTEDIVELPLTDSLPFVPIIWPCRNDYPVAALAVSTVEDLPRVDLRDNFLKRYSQKDSNELIEEYFRRAMRTAPWTSLGGAIMPYGEELMGRFERTYIYSWEENAVLPLTGRTWPYDASRPGIIDTIYEMYDRLEELNEEAEKEIKEINKEIEEIRESIEELRDNPPEELNTSAQINDAIYRQIDRANVRIVALQDSSKKLQEEIKSIQAEKAQLEEELNELRVRLAALQGELADTAPEGNTAGLNAEIARLEDEIHELEDELEAVEEERTRLTRDINNIDLEIVRLRSRIADLRAGLLPREPNENYEAAMEQLQEQLQELEDEREYLGLWPKRVVMNCLGEDEVPISMPVLDPDGGIMSPGVCEKREIRTYVETERKFIDLPVYAITPDLKIKTYKDYKSDYPNLAPEQLDFDGNIPLRSVGVATTRSFASTGPAVHLYRESHRVITEMTEWGPRFDGYSYKFAKYSTHHKLMGRVVSWAVTWQKADNGDLGYLDITIGDASYVFLRDRDGYTETFDIMEYPNPESSEFTITQSKTGYPKLEEVSWSTGESDTDDNPIEHLFERNKRLKILALPSRDYLSPLWGSGPIATEILTSDYHKNNPEATALDIPMDLRGRVYLVGEPNLPDRVGTPGEMVLSRTGDLGNRYIYKPGPLGTIFGLPGTCSLIFDGWIDAPDGSSKRYVKKWGGVVAADTLSPRDMITAETNAAYLDPVPFLYSNPRYSGSTPVHSGYDPKPSYCGQFGVILHPGSDTVPPEGKPPYKLLDIEIPVSPGRKHAELLMRYRDVVYAVAINFEIGDGPTDVLEPYVRMQRKKIGFRPGEEDSESAWYPRVLDRWEGKLRHLIQLYPEMSPTGPYFSAAWLQAYLSVMRDNPDANIDFNTIVDSIAGLTNGKDYWSRINRVNAPIEHLLYEGWPQTSGTVNFYEGESPRQAITFRPTLPLDYPELHPKFGLVVDDTGKPFGSEVDSKGKTILDIPPLIAVLAG